MNKYNTIIIGGGPAGLACAVKLNEKNIDCLIIEREHFLGGILKQCIHDGFGLQRFKEKLSGPEYAERFIDEIFKRNIPFINDSFVISIEKRDSFILHVSTVNGIEEYVADNLVMATGCRERTAKQVEIHGTRPKGVYTAGAVQHLVNIDGLLPGKECVILGSGDIGLIMARRLTLEGVKVKGVYEIMPSPSGLRRNIEQCLNDFDIPLRLSTTVTRTMGKRNLEAVEVMKVDEKLKPIAGSEEIISCDCLIVSVGLIPENELAERIGVVLDAKAKGAHCDLDFETNVDHVYTCGNAAHVNDLVDYVSESGEIVAEAISKRNNNPRKLLPIQLAGKTSYLAPEMIDIHKDNSKRILYFRSNSILSNPTVSVKVRGETIFEKKYLKLRPPEMERIVVDFPLLNENDEVVFEIKEGQ